MHTHTHISQVSFCRITLLYYNKARDCGSEMKVMGDYSQKGAGKRGHGDAPASVP